MAPPRTTKIKATASTIRTSYKQKPEAPVHLSFWHLQRPPDHLNRRRPSVQVLMQRYIVAALFTFICLAFNCQSTCEAFAASAKQQASLALQAVASSSNSNPAKTDLKQYQALSSTQASPLGPLINQHFNSNNNSNYKSSPLLTPTGFSTTLPSTRSESINIIDSYSKNSSVSNLSQQLQSQKVSQANQATHQRHQPKSFKFTLICGKFWRFNIKPNTFVHHKEAELRLHKNLSANNYIIDDDFWFQYDPQQQQLFAWPSLIAKPGTHHFVLLPSGIDFEVSEVSEAEFVNSNLNVVANIVVEIIRPLYQSTETSDGELDQLIDHKFSLDFLHRRSNYPLLLQQIIAVLDSISAKPPVDLIPFGPTPLDQNNRIASELKVTHIRNNQTHRPQTRKPSTSRLNELLLISYSYTSDGEYFSITWSNHPALANNTISQIQDCRTSLIKSTVSKLSISPTTALVVQTPSSTPLLPASSSFNAYYQANRDESRELLVFYQIDAPIISSKAIIPTERGNFALKLTLCTPCYNRRVVDELGLVTSSQIDGLHQPSRDGIGSSLSKIATTFEPAFVEPINTLVEPTQLNTSQITLRNSSRFPYSVELPIETTSDSTSSANNSTEDTFVTSAASTITILTTTSTTTSTTTTTTTTTPSPDSIPSTELVFSESTTTETVRDTPVLNTTLISKEISSNTTTDQTSSILRSANFGESAPKTTSSSSQIFGAHPKSFVNYLDSNVPNSLLPNQSSFDPRIDNLNTTMSTIMSTNNSSPLNQTELMTMSKPATDILDQEFFSSKIDEINNVTTISPITTSFSSLPKFQTDINQVVVPSLSQESTLNDDFMFLLNDVAEYLVSVTVPISIGVGLVLLVSIFIALCSLFKRKKKSKEFDNRNRFNFRYQSERRAFMKSSSKPVILDADDKSLSMSGTPKKISASLGCFSGEGNKHGKVSSGDTGRQSIVYLPMDSMVGANSNDCSIP